MFIKSRISKSIRDFIPQCSKIKDFLKVIDEQFVHSNKALTKTLMKRLSDMSFDYSKGVRGHIMEMIDYSKGLCRHIMEMKDITT
jgi:predicted chitinase